MPAHPPATAIGATSRRARHFALLTSVSIMALALASSPAHAISVGSRSNTTTSATTIASDAARAAAQQAQEAAQRAQQSLSRATQALRSMQDIQAAARAAATAAGTGGVTDGLSAGGLIVDPRVRAGTDPNLWVNAKQPTQTTSNGTTTVTVQQTSQRAIMTWAQFNVGKNTILNFDQSGGNSPSGNSWVALNRIDASGSPSQILGQINAQGTVLIINPNGIIFTGTSQINVHTLIASASDINGFTLNRNGVPYNVSAFSSSGDAYVPVQVNGVAQTGANGSPLYAPSTEDNANVQFVTNGLFAPGQGNTPTLILTAAALPDQATSAGIVVQRGASITTDISGFDNGGFVALVGPSVTNAGTITTGSGQIILAAAPSVYINQPTISMPSTSLSVQTNAGATSYLGLVYQGATVPSTGVLENDGLLVSNNGNITLVGSLVNQFGVAEATTSVNRAGSFNIYADTQLTFGGNSVTAILPDENGKNIPGNSVSAFVGPSITINATNVDLQGDVGGAPGALIVAPGAAVTLATAAFGPTSGEGYNPAGRFFMESGSIIDLAGLNATGSVADFLYTFKVTANDVADSPLAKNLIGETVTIDLRQSGTRSDGLSWVGSPLFSATGAGYLGDIPQTIDQLLTKGGSLTFLPVGTYLPFLDVLQQRAPVSLTLNQSAYVEAFASPFNPNPDNASLNAGILIDNGAAVLGDPGAQITLTANGPVTVLGKIIAPGGSIALTNNGIAVDVNRFINNGGNPTTGSTSAPQDIWLGPNAVLDVTGAFVPNPLLTAYQTDSVLPGGSISLAGGTIVALPGSRFNFAGASATIQVPASSAVFGSSLTVPQRIWSDGGSLTISGNPNVSNTGVTVLGVYQAVYFDGTIDAAGGGQGSGGKLTVTGADYYSNYPLQFAHYVSSIIVPQSGPVTGALNSSALDVTGPAYPTSAAQLAALLPMTNGAIQNYSYISADTINSGGLGSVSLNASTIAFSGNVNLKVPGTLALAGAVTLLPAGVTDPTYTAPSIGATTVNLNAGYISLSNFVGIDTFGGYYQNNVNPPSFSDGTINFNASAQIDLFGRAAVSYQTDTLAISNAANVNLNSGGDIRLLGQFLYNVTSNQTQSQFAHQRRLLPDLSGRHAAGAQSRYHQRPQLYRPRPIRPGRCHRGVPSRTRCVSLRGLFQLAKQFSWPDGLYLPGSKL